MWWLVHQNQLQIQSKRIKEGPYSSAAAPASHSQCFELKSREARKEDSELKPRQQENGLVMLNQWHGRIVWFPWTYNVSNGFMVIWLFGQLYVPLVTNSLSSQTWAISCWALLEPLPPSRGEREETLNTPPFMGGLLAGHGRPARPLPQGDQTQQQQGGTPAQRAG
jgi:hypothetical protein